MMTASFLYCTHEDNHGLGSVKFLPGECARLGIKKAFLVTDAGIVKAAS